MIDIRHAIVLALCEAAQKTGERRFVEIAQEILREKEPHEQPN